MGAQAHGQVRDNGTRARGERQSQCQCGALAWLRSQLISSKATVMDCPCSPSRGDAQSAQITPIGLQLGGNCLERTVHVRQVFGPASIAVHVVVQLVLRAGVE